MAFGNSSFSPASNNSVVVIGIYGLWLQLVLFGTRVHIFIFIEGAALGAVKVGTTHNFCYRNTYLLTVMSQVETLKLTAENLQES